MARVGALRANQNGALLCLDLDRFKPINDNLGHEAGDSVLVQTAKRLTDCLRQVDTVARLGGDEFVVVLSGLPSETQAALSIVERIAAKLCHAIEQPFIVRSTVVGGEVKTIECAVSVSVGGLLFDGKEKHNAALMKKADEMMYDAKRAGGGRAVIYSPPKKNPVISQSA